MRARGSCACPSCEGLGRLAPRKAGEGWPAVWPRDEAGFLAAVRPRVWRRAAEVGILDAVLDAGGGDAWAEVRAYLRCAREDRAARWSPEIDGPTLSDLLAESEQAAEAAEDAEHERLVDRVLAGLGRTRYEQALVEMNALDYLDEGANLGDALARARADLDAWRAHRARKGAA